LATTFRFARLVQTLPTLPPQKPITNHIMKNSGLKASISKRSSPCCDLVFLWQADNGCFGLGMDGNLYFTFVQVSGTLLDEVSEEAKTNASTCLQNCEVTLSVDGPLGGMIPFLGWPSNLAKGLPVSVFHGSFSRPPPQGSNTHPNILPRRSMRGSHRRRRNSVWWWWGV